MGDERKSGRFAVLGAVCLLAFITYVQRLGFVNVAPTITTQPTDVTVTAGQVATFTVSAIGTAPLSYQWKLGSTNVATDTSTLILSNAQAAIAGTYTCTVTNGGGSAISNSATLTVTSAGGSLDALISSSARIDDGGGSYDSSDSTAAKAFDGSTATFYDAATSSGAYTGVDVGAGNVATVTAIRYWARSGWSSRMIGGIFEASNNSTSGYVILGTISSASDTTWTTLTVTSAIAYRYLRYRGPDGSWCNVAEIEFRGTKTISSRSTPQMVRDHFGTKRGDLGFLDSADANGDGQINAIDLSQAIQGL